MRRGLPSGRLEGKGTDLLTIAVTGADGRVTARSLIFQLAG